MANIKEAEQGLIGFTQFALSQSACSGPCCRGEHMDLFVRYNQVFML